MPSSLSPAFLNESEQPLFTTVSSASIAVPQHSQSIPTSTFLSTPITKKFANFYGRNGLRSNLSAIVRNQLHRNNDTNDDSAMSLNEADANDTATTGDQSSITVNCLNRSSSGSGDAKGYKLLNHSINSQSDHTFIH